MANKERIICKYKFQDKEKFSGKPYCTCFSELCEDLSFICDHNCQIYEDYKQLIYKTQECENLKEDYKELEQRHNGVFQDFERLKQKIKELKSESFTREELITLQEKDIEHYRKTFEETEVYIKNNVCKDCKPMLGCLGCGVKDCLDILKQKGECRNVINY